MRSTALFVSRPVFALSLGLKVTQTKGNWVNWRYYLHIAIKMLRMGKSKSKTIIKNWFSCPAKRFMYPKKGSPGKSVVYGFENCVESSSVSTLSLPVSLFWTLCSLCAHCCGRCLVCYLHQIWDLLCSSTTRNCIDITVTYLPLSTTVRHRTCWHINAHCECPLCPLCVCVRAWGPG